MLKNERETLKNSVLKVGNWPVSKSELTSRYLKQFIRYINSMDFEKINHSNRGKWTLTTNMHDYNSILFLTVMEHAEDLINK